MKIEISKTASCSEGNFSLLVDDAYRAENVSEWACRDAAKWFLNACPQEPRAISDTEWMGFAGACRFPATFAEIESRPVIVEINGYLVIACGEQTGCYGNVTDEYPEGEMWGMPGVVFPTQAAAIAWLKCLPGNFTPKAFGFVAN